MYYLPILEAGSPKSRCGQGLPCLFLGSGGGHRLWALLGIPRPARMVTWPPCIIVPQGVHGPLPLSGLKVALEDPERCPWVPAAHEADRRQQAGEATLRGESGTSPLCS